MGSKIRQFIFHLLVLLILAAILIVGSDTTLTPVSQSDEVLPEILSGTSSSLPELCNRFGAAVPCTSLNGTGSLTCADGSYTLTWNENGGLSVICVRPNSKAALLRQDMGLTGSTWSFGDIDLVIAGNASSCCAYFSNDDAAYALVYQGTEEDFQSLLSSLQFINPS